MSEAGNEACRRWYQKNRDRQIARAALYRRQFQEKYRAEARASYSRNKHKHAEKRRKSSREWYERTREARLAQKRAYYQANKGLFFMRNRDAKARRRGAEGKFTILDVIRMFNQQNGCCKICGDYLLRYEIDHIIPIIRGGTNWPENLQLLCKPCNCRKGGK